MTAALREVLRNTLDNLTEDDFKRFKHRLRDQGQIKWGKLEKADKDDTVDLMVQVYSTGAGDVMLTILKKMNHNQLAMDLERDLEELGDQQCSPGLVRGDGGVKVDITADSGGMVDAPALSGGSPMLQQGGDDNAAEEVIKKKTSLKLKLREHLKKRFSFVHQESGVSNVQDIYTELYIVEGRTDGVNSTHEVSTINMSQIGRGPSSEDKQQVHLANMFTDGSATKVLTMGVAGVGKTVAVQKFVMDWVDEKANQDIDFIFVLPFRELNLKKGERFNLLQLLQLFYPNLEDLENIPDLSECKIIFVLDGLDESRLQLDFGNWISKLGEESSVDILITSLIKGMLLSSALLWVTTRPAATSQIPKECFNFLTEVRGFNDLQIIEFFEKNIKNPEKAKRIIDHIKENRSLHIMCHIPVFCRIIANVMDKILEDQSKEESAKTLTALYTWYSVSQIKRMNDKYPEDKEMSAKEKGDLLVKLGKLAFKHLEKGSLIFYKKDLKKCNIGIDCGALKAGVCTQIFNLESASTGEDIFSFVHLSVQEFLAALYVLHEGVQRANPFPKNWKEKTSWLFTHSRFDLFKMAVDKALLSQNGQYDLFVRFLLGLAPMLEPEIRSPLKQVLPQLAIREESIEKTVQYIKEKIREDISPERTINLFHCLNELGDNSLVEEINRYMNSADEEKNLTPAQCSALAYLLLMSAEDLDEFDLRRYLRSEEGLRRMLPVVKVSRRVGLISCGLSKASCKMMASVMQRTPSHLRYLDMGGNLLLKDEGVELLCDGLRDPQCKLEILRLMMCSLTEKSCAALASAARSTSCSLKQLDLGRNKIHDAGVQYLSDLLKNPYCKLETLKLELCSLREKSCAALASANRSTACSLIQLNLGGNKIHDAGVQHLSDLLKNPHCKLETLVLEHCSLTEKSCAALASAARSTSCSLKQLNLRNNKIHDAGVQHLSDLLKNPHCKLETLQLRECSLTEKSCAALASAARSTSCSLKQLDLGLNKIHDAGVQHLSDLLKYPHCKLETLELERCSLTEKSCAALASAARSTSCSLKHLDLGLNKIHDAGVQHLSDLLKNPHCKLEKLVLVYCSLTENSCAALASAVRSTSCSLKQLNLGDNEIHDAVQHLSDLLKNPHCKLETLKMNYQTFRRESPAAAASASSG